MSQTYYVAMVSRRVTCPECQGDGFAGGGADYGDCQACAGTGDTGEIRLEPMRSGIGRERAIRLHDEPGKASGAATRWAAAAGAGDPLPTEVRIINLDDCEAYDRGWTNDQRFQYAERRYLYWYERCQRLQAIDAGLAFQVKYDPQLEAADWALIRRLLSNALTPTHDILARLDAKAAIDQLDDQAAAAHEYIRITVAKDKP